MIKGSRHPVAGSFPRKRAVPLDHHTRRRWVIAGAVVVLLATALALPPVRDRLVAAAVLADAVDAPVPRPFAADVQRRAIDLGATPADLYDPAGDDERGLLLVPGAAPAGRDDERVVRLATALARSGIAVVVPELRIYDGEFAEADLDTLADAVRHLGDVTAADDVTLLGISFGGSLALVAAADPRVREDVGVVATFGAYADMVGLLQAAATGVSTVDGERHVWQPPPQAEDALHRLAVQITPAVQREELQQALRSGDPSGLPPPAMAAFELVTVEDPAAVEDLVQQLPDQAQRDLARFSPAAVADGVRADVLALHSRDDPAVPYAELLRLRQVFPDARTYTVSSFDHVDLETDAGVGTLVSDLWTTWRFAGHVLRRTS